MSKAQDILRKVAKQLHDGTMVPGSVSPEMIQYYANILFKAVQLGYDSVLPQEDIHRYTQLRALRENVYVFSGFKNYQMLQEVSLLLTDSGGNIRPFTEFMQDVLQIDSTYNKTYLRAEYNHAVSSSTLIAKWEKFNSERDIYPNLRYRTVGDGRVRKDHERIDGTVLPLDDPWWDIYYPPNDWNCRCDVEQVEGEPTAVPKNAPTIKPMFRSNVGKEGIVFTASHPYFKVQSKNKRFKHVPKDVSKHIKDTAILTMPIQDQWTQLVKFANGGEVLEHILVDKNASDYSRLIIIAKDMASEGKKVELLPIIHAKETALRDKIFPGYNKHPKNPDLRIDGMYWEEESPILPLNYKKIINRIKQGSRQADNVILNLPNKVNKSKMYKIAYLRFKDIPTLNIIVFKYKKTYTIIHRRQVIKKGKS